MTLRANMVNYSNCRVDSLVKIELYPSYRTVDPLGLPQLLEVDFHH